MSVFGDPYQEKTLMKKCCLLAVAVANTQGYYEFALPNKNYYLIGKLYLYRKNG